METELKQPQAGLGSIEETNRLLGGSYFNEQGSQVKPFNPSVISSENLSNTEPPVVVPPTTTSTTAEGISGLAQVQAEQAKLVREQEAKAQEAQQSVSTEKQSLTDVMKQIIGLQSSRAQAEKDAGLDVKAQKVADVTNQIEASQRAQMNELRALEGQGLTPIQKQQQSQAINRRYAFEQADLALIQSAANRDLDTASRIIDRKIQLQLEPLQTQLEFTKFFYQENKDSLTKAEDRAFNLKINQLDKQYETEKANRTAIANIQLEALKNGVNIPSSVMTQLNTAKDAAEATSILARNGISLENPVDRAYKQAQTEKLYFDMTPTADGNNMVNIPNVGLVNGSAAALAQEYASTGKLPSSADLKAAGTTFAEVTRIAKESPKFEGAIVDVNTGIKSSAVSQAAQEDFSRLYNITKMANELVELDKERWGGVVSGTIGKVFGSADQAAYLTKRKAIVDELSRMQSGAALTADEVAFYEEYLPGRFSEAFFLGQDSGKKIENFAKEMNQKLNNRLANNGLVIYGFSTVKVGDQLYKVGDTISNGQSEGRVNPDGTITEINSIGDEVSVQGARNAEAIASAIKRVESNGNYSAKGQSGESGAYQFMPSTWKEWAGEYLGNSGAPMTEQNQDKVAIAKINDLLSQGYNEEEIALIWNGGTPKPKKGTNSKGVKYDSGAYARRVLKALNS